MSHTKLENEQELDVRPSPYATPGSIGPTTKDGGAKVESKSKDIWSADEVLEKQEYEYDDPRPQPEYDILFKQSVGTEDVFLGMGAKNPTTACCEGMLVREPETRSHIF